MELGLPVAQCFLHVVRGRVWRFNRVSQFAEDPGSFLGHVAGDGGGLPAPPAFTASLDAGLPSGLCVELALSYQELDEVLKAWTEPGAAHRDMKRRHVVRVSVPGSRE